MIVVFLTTIVFSYTEKDRFTSDNLLDSRIPCKTRRGRRVWNTYIHVYTVLSYSAQSYIKKEQLWSTKVHPDTSNEQNKSDVRRLVFGARRKAACESVSLISTEWLFQMSGPQTEKARRPNWVVVGRTTSELAADDRSWRRCGHSTDAECVDVLSLRYGGERWWKILCMVVATLKIIQNFIGSQWSCLTAD